ncbi:hypothetical protein BCEP27_110091 [Burkholderia cepacia]
MGGISAPPRSRPIALPILVEPAQAGTRRAARRQPAPGRSATRAYTFTEYHGDSDRR